MSELLAFPAPPPVPIELRPFQLFAIEEIRKAIRAGHKRIVLVIPTGGGKTLTAGSIVHGSQAKGKRVLFVAHRKELIDQSVTAFYKLGVHPVGVIRAGDKRRNLSLPIQVASIQTLARRPLLDPPPDIIFIDEAHRAIAKGYQKFLYEAYPNAVIVGLTATPIRADGKPLREAFAAMVIAARYSEVIAGGWIDAPLVYGTPVLPDLTKVRTHDGEYDQDDLDEAVNNSVLIGNVGEEWGKRAEGRRTVVFCVSVNHSLAVRDMFRGLGVRAEHIDGTTPEDERALILARLERGDVQLVCNVGVLCEGWDCPPVKCLQILRPTKSLSLFIQMGGRILRPWGGIAPILIDHAGNVDRHGLPHADQDWTLDGKPKKIGAAPMKPCPECFAYVPGGCKTCPICGAAFLTQGSPLEEDKPPPVPVDLALRTLTGEDAQLAFFRAEHRKARDRGWKPGAVMHRFREKFNADPPAAWWGALKSDARGDTEWKQKIKARPVPQGDS